MEKATFSKTVCLLKHKYYPQAAFFTGILLPESICKNTALIKVLGFTANKEAWGIISYTPKGKKEEKKPYKFPVIWFI